MDQRIENLKRVNLVEFLSRHYGLSFTRRGSAYACRSPFTEETTASFFVRLVRDHWLFKDFSSNTGGSIFDFVQLKEGLKSFREALAFVQRMILGAPVAPSPSAPPAALLAVSKTDEEREPAYDVAELYERFRREDPDPCRDYLRGRRIAADLVEAMIEGGTVVHNRYQDRSYCCFAVRDPEGRLQCLDNHAIEGKGIFVLGSKAPFSLEWEALKKGREVFVAEGIIDYLSVKTLEESAPPGLALLGNQVSFDPVLVQDAEVIVSALDDDEGGRGGVLDLQASYPEKEIRIYDLEGHNDPNEFLQAVRSGAGRKLNAERKLQLFREFQRSSNKAELARRWGIDRSYLYTVVRDCEESIVQALTSRRRGRRPRGAPATLAEAHERIKELEARYEEEATAREEFYCRSELMAIRLKWAEIEAAELRGETVDEDKGPAKTPHVKKKEKEETLMKIDELAGQAGRLTQGRIMTYTGFSRSQLHQWRKGEQLERKERDRKAIPEETVENVARTIITFPHLGGRKGQAYMLYHHLGYVGMKCYDRIKGNVKRLLGREVSRRDVLPVRGLYEHIRPTRAGEIWSEDFTDLVVEGCRFKVATLMDVFSLYVLGVAVAARATAALVGKPVEQALEVNGGRGPEKFLLSDNGSQYISGEHGEMLTSAEIVQRRIPACVPQYNGTIESNMVDIKSVFYNVWERRTREGADEEKSLLERVQAAVLETVLIINEALPRPSLGGVTPADVHHGREKEVKTELQAYRELEESRRDVPPWTRSIWEIVKSGLELDRMADGELLTKLAFFHRRPLRRIARRHQESVG